MVSFKITYFQSLLHLLAVLGYLPKLKRGTYGTNFYCRFFHTFSIKIFLVKNFIKRPSFNIWREWPSGFKHYNQNWKVPNSNPFQHSAGLFITVIWLSHSQLCAIFKETVSLTQCLSKCFLQLWQNIITRLLVNFESKLLQCSD